MYIWYVYVCVFIYVSIQSDKAKYYQLLALVKEYMDNHHTILSAILSTIFYV